MIYQNMFYGVSNEFVLCCTCLCIFHKKIVKAGEGLSYDKAKTTCDLERAS